MIRREWADRIYEDEDLFKLMMTNVESVGDCVLWTGRSYQEARGDKRTIGRAEMQKNKVRKRFLAHRLMWMLVHKEELTDEDEIRRTCNNGLCVKPSHLVKGTRSDTINSMIERGTTHSGNSFARLHDHTQIIKDHKSGMSYVELMEKYGIKSKGTISYIINKSKENSA